MQYKCDKCNDSGMILGSYNFDCSACEAATDRVALEAFIESLPAMGEQEQAWRIHQRALAMAPKQEAPAVAFDAATFIENKAAAYLDENASTDPDDGSTIFHYGSGGSEYYNGLVELAEEIRLAAPAIANGALTDDADLGEGLPSLPEAIEVGGEGWGWEDFQSQKVFSVEHMFKYARAAIALAASVNGSPTDERAAFEASKPTMHIKRNHFGMYENLYVHHAWEAWQDRSALAALVVAAGPDAVLVDKALRVLEGYAENYDMMSRIGKTGDVDCRSVAHDIRRNMVDGVRAALSGAKGN